MLKQALTGAQFKIVKSKDFYTIEGVKLPSGRYGDVQVTTDMLNGWKYETQDKFVRTGWLGSAPLITAVLTTLYHNQYSDGVEELRQLFAHDFSHVVMTATSVTYRAEGLDVVTPDAGAPRQRTLEAHLVMPNGGEVPANVVQALLGNSDAALVMNVYRWVTLGIEPLISLSDEHPKKDEKLPLFLGDFYRDDDFFIGTLYNSKYGLARGVRVAPPVSTGSRS